MATFYATISKGEIRPYMPAVAVLLPASSWLPTVPKLPPQITEKAADSGGFAATFRWGGTYRYSPAEYVRWLDGWEPGWAATFDFCCEDHPGIVRERQKRTTEYAYHFWRYYRDRAWAWVPTVQGWQVEDYQRHAEEMRPLIEEMHAYYGEGREFRVGIGTLVPARADRESRLEKVALVCKIVAVIAALFPGIRIHLWGKGLGLLSSKAALPPQVDSFDSSSWNARFKTDLEAYRQSGLSQRSYGLQIALPSYLEKIRSALSEPKQGLLF